MASHSLSRIIMGAFLLSLVIEPTTAQVNFMSTKKSEFLSSLYKLEGIQKGQTKEGLIKQLKTYLKALGYSSTNDEVLINDVFDDDLESSIKLYQKYNHLKVTGQLDSNTIKTMSIPHYYEPNHRSNHYFHGVSHYELFGPIWSKTHLSYFIDLSNSPISGQDLSAICSRSFQRWAKVSSLTFREASQGEQYDIVIAFSDLPNNLLGYGYEPENGRLYLDSAANWSTSEPTLEQYDLESLTTHELGHVLGLRDSQDQSAVMYHLFNLGEVRRDLSQDDINGIRALYPQ